MSGVVWTQAGHELCDGGARLCCQDRSRVAQRVWSEVGASGGFGGSTEVVSQGRMRELVSLDGIEEEPVASQLGVVGDVLLDRRDQVGRDVDVTDRCDGFRGGDGDVSVDARYISADADHACLEVDVVSAQLGDFSESEGTPCAELDDEGEARASRS
jgi:hypothetical protein